MPTMISLVVVCPFICKLLSDLSPVILLERRIYSVAALAQVSHKQTLGLAAFLKRALSRFIYEAFSVASHNFLIICLHNTNIRNKVRKHDSMENFFLSSLYSPRWARHANRLKTLLNLWIWIYFLLVRSSFKWECVFSFVWVFVYILASPLPTFHPATHTFT